MKGEEAEARDPAGWGEEARRRWLRLHYPEVGFVPAPPPPGAERASEIIPTHLLSSPSGFTCGRAGRAGSRGQGWGGACPAAAPGPRPSPSPGVAAAARLSPPRPAPQVCAGRRRAGLRCGSPCVALAHLSPPTHHPGTTGGGFRTKPALDLERPREPRFGRCPRAGLREPPEHSGT